MRKLYPIESTSKMHITEALAATKSAVKNFTSMEGADSGKFGTGVEMRRRAEWKGDWVGFGLR